MLSGHVGRGIAVTGLDRVVLVREAISCDDRIRHQLECDWADVPVRDLDLKLCRALRPSCPRKKECFQTRAKKRKSDD